MTNQCAACGRPTDRDELLCAPCYEAGIEQLGEQLQALAAAARGTP